MHGLNTQPRTPLHSASPQPPEFDAEKTQQLASAAQRRWEARPIRERLHAVQRIRHELVDRADEICATITSPFRQDAAETLAAELIPVADACHFLEKEACKILRARRVSRRGRPWWLSRSHLEIRREALGIVLIIGATNYPLFLPGVQTLQAITAGNAVLLKPGLNSTSTAHCLMEIIKTCTAEDHLVQLLPEDPSSVRPAVQAGVDKVLLTGSAETGRRVLPTLAPTLTPATTELSGCDAFLLLEDADLSRAAEALAFGLRFNQSATCIAPRRVFVLRDFQRSFEKRVAQELVYLQPSALTLPASVRDLIEEAIAQGARRLGPSTEALGRFPLVLTDARAEMRLLQTDVFWPVISIVPVDSLDEAVERDATCPFGLGAAIWGNAAAAQRLATRLRVGCVVINDLIAPTADPRVPFGGRRQSGFGVTRGAEGLVELTQIKAVIEQKSRWLPHLETPTPADAELLTGFLRMCHGRDWRTRFSGLREAMRAAVAQRSWQKKQTSEGELDDE